MEGNPVHAPCQAYKHYLLTDPYVVAGRRAYLIGQQDGYFRDMGGHVPHEMGGMWSQPIKVLDGFWLGIGSDPYTASWLPPAHTFANAPTHCVMHYSTPQQVAVKQITWAAHEVEAIVVTYRLQGLGAPLSTAVPVVFLARTELRGVWESERLGWQDGPDAAEYLAKQGIVHAWDTVMPFHAVIGLSSGQLRSCEIGAIWGPHTTFGKGVSVALMADLVPDAAGIATATFVISSSMHTVEQAVNTWRQVAENIDAQWNLKQTAYARELAWSSLQVPDAAVSDLFTAIKVGYEHLYRQTDTYGCGLAAGYAEYPWWFGCDNSYALQGALAVGRFELAKETLQLLAQVSEQTNQNGRIVHEVTTNGVVYNPGNTQETAHFVIAVWDTFLWTGDKEFLSAMYPICQKGVLGWLLGEKDTDDDLLPEGYGIMEVAGVNWELIDTAVYTQQALLCLEHMAAIAGESAVAARAGALARQLLEVIESRFWIEEQGLYGDLIAAPEMLLARLEQIRKQAGNEGAATQQALADIEQRCLASDPDTELVWNLENWVIFCPVEAGIADPERARRALDQMLTPRFTSRFGLYLSGINRTHVMTISTGVAAVAQARYHRMEAALGYIQQIAQTGNLRLPGAPSEMSPDYGCFLQAWTGYGVAYPIVRQFFGISPHASKRRVHCAPHLPSSWPQAELQHVRVGDNEFAFRISACSAEQSVQGQIVSAVAGWEISLSIDPAWYGLAAGTYELLVNGEVVAQGSAGSAAQATWVATGHDTFTLQLQRKGGLL